MVLYASQNPAFAGFTLLVKIAQENMSWRKMDPGGLFTEIRTDATLVWPFLVRFAMDMREES